MEDKKKSIRNKKEIVEEIKKKAGKGMDRWCKKIRMKKK
jgi:hypothetical protein